MKAEADELTSPLEGYEAAQYKRLDGTYNRGSGTSYVLAAGDEGDYVFIYAAEYTLSADELTANASAVSYNYNGGRRNITVNIQHNGSEDVILGALTMPVWIVSGKVASIEGMKFGLDGQTDLSGGSNSLSIDPFDLEGSITDAVAGGYKYFPNILTLNTIEDDATGISYVIRDVAVTWSNLGSIRVAYGGNDYDARFTIGKTDAFGAQGFTVDSFVHVESRAAVDGTLTPNNGTLPTVGYADKNPTPSDYIDPYEFDLSAFRAEVEQITSVTVSINDEESGRVEKTFTTDGQDGYTLVWSFAGMAVNYLGGRVALIAQLTGPDGSTQNYEIDYLVTRKVVSRIYATKGLSDRDKPAEEEEINSDTLWFTFGTDPDADGFGTVNGGDSDKAYYSNGTYVIDPFIPSTQSLPTGWNVTFALSKPVLGENGVVTWQPVENGESQSYSYITTIMPSTAAVTADVANSADGKPNAGDATMQIDGGQRLRIPVSITGSMATGTDTPGRSNSTLTSRVAGTNGDVNVVWYGRVRITYNIDNTAEYWVTLTDPTGNGIAIEGIEGRTVEYYLTAYVGAVINASGKVLDSVDGVPAGTASTRVSFSVSGTTITDIDWADPLP